MLTRVLPANPGEKYCMGERSRRIEELPRCTPSLNTPLTYINQFHQKRKRGELSSWCHLVVGVLKAEVAVLAEEEAVVFGRAGGLSSHGEGGAGGRAETCGALALHLLARLVLTRHWHDQHCTVPQCSVLHCTGTNSLCYCALPWPRSRKGRERSGSLVRHPGQPFGTLKIKNK